MKPNFIIHIIESVRCPSRDGIIGAAASATDMVFQTERFANLICRKLNEQLVDDCYDDATYVVRRVGQSPFAGGPRIVVNAPDYGTDDIPF